MYKIHEEEYKGVTIKVFSDDTAESPEEWGNDDVCFWNNRELWVENKNVSLDIFRSYIDPKEYPDNKEEVRELKKKFHVFGVDAYIHSGISLSLHGEGMRCSFDTSNYIGCVIVAKSEARTLKQAERIARGIILTWNDYLQGNIYGFMLEDKDMRGDFGGCWGFYGDYRTSGLLDEAKSEVDTYLKEEREASIKLEVKTLRQKADELEAKIK